MSSSSSFELRVDSFGLKIGNWKLVLATQNIGNTHPNPAQEKNKRCAAKHLPLRTFLYNALWCRPGSKIILSQNHTITQPNSNSY